MAGTKLSDAEWTVMDVVWTKNPATVRDVLEGLPNDTEWAYSTVKTLLSRLVEKQALAVEKQRNLSHFTPLIEREQARQSALRNLLDRAFDGSFGGLVQHLTKPGALSSSERRQLRQLLDTRPRTKRRRDD